MRPPSLMANFLTAYPPGVGAAVTSILGLAMIGGCLWFRRSMRPADHWGSSGRPVNRAFGAGGRQLQRW